MNEQNSTIAQDKLASDAEPANRPMSDLAKLYQEIEAALRKSWQTVAQLNHTPHIEALARNKWQVKQVVKVMEGHDCLDVTGQGKTRAYQWRKDAPPFTLSLKMKAKAEREPSAPVTKSPPEYERTAAKGAELSANIKLSGRQAMLPDAPVATPKPLELVVNGFIILMDTNPDTGNDRIVIERIWNK